MWKPTISSDELCHHGIQGQKWGKKNGPPYPLGAEDHSESEKKAGWRKSLTDEQKATLKKAATGVLIVGGVALGAYAISQHPELLDYAKSGAQIVKDNFSEKTVEEIAKDSTNITEKGKEIAKELGLKLKTTASSPANDSAVGNPGWKVNQGSPDWKDKWENNCSHSVMNFVLRRKGLDTKATEMAFDESGGLSMGELCTYFKGAKPSGKIRLTANDGSAGTYEKVAKKYIADRLGGLDDGACGAIEVRGKTGHFIAWCNDGGQIKIFNTQPGYNNATDVFESMANPRGGYSNDVRFVRLDNLELNYKQFKHRPFCESI